MTFRALWTALVAALCPACALPSLRPVELARVADAPQATSARAMTLTAQSVREVRGVGTWVTRAQRSGGGADDVATHEMWVVPLVDPGEALGQQVAAWVTPSEHLAGGASPEAWFARLASELDGQRLTLKVASRAAEARKSESGWGKAITDAEARFGVQSHPDAPVLFFPSP